MLDHRVPLGVLQRLSSQVTNSYIPQADIPLLQLSLLPLKSSMGCYSVFLLVSCFSCRIVTAISDAAVYSQKGSLQKSGQRNERFKHLEVYSSGRSRLMQTRGYS